jgi:uncharacterized protein YkwD
MPASSFDLPVLTRRVTLAGLGLALLSGCTTVTVLQPEPGNSNDHTGTVLPLINKLRAAKHLPPLTADPAAIAAATDQANRMAKAGEMNHELRSEDDFTSRMKRMGVRLQAAENIATGQDTAERAFEAWVHSPKHLKNMLGPYKGLGVAVSQNTASDNRPFWSMVLSN